jgi:hypothetical protein
MKEIKFSRTNLGRHTALMKYIDPVWKARTIYTARDYPLGDVGEQFTVGNEVFTLLDVSEHKKSIDFFGKFFGLEGFNNMYEFRNEINKIYPDAEVLYMHVLAKVQEEE